MFAGGVHDANVWPREDLPELEPALKTLGATMCKVATALLRACAHALEADRLAAQDTVGSTSASAAGAAFGGVGATDCNGQSGQTAGSGAHSGRHRGVVAQAVPSSQCTTRSPSRLQLAPPLSEQRSNKARLLHYYPVPGEHAAPEAWCGWHVDHGTLTALTSAMYLPSPLPPHQHAPELAADELPCPDGSIGLHVRTRAGEVVRVTAARDQLLFQAVRSNYAVASADSVVFIVAKTFVELQGVLSMLRATARWHDRARAACEATTRGAQQQDDACMVGGSGVDRATTRVR